MRGRSREVVVVPSFTLSVACEEVQMLWGLMEVVKMTMIKMRMVMVFMNVGAVLVDDEDNYNYKDSGSGGRDGIVAV